MNNEILALEHKISTKIFTDNGCSTHFKYEAGKVSAYTFNPKTNESFLLKSAMGKKSMSDALQEIVDYLETQKDSASYTVVWAKKDLSRSDVGGGTKQSSYFYCHHVLEAINRFFEGKEVLDYIIYEVKLNPIA